MILCLRWFNRIIFSSIKKTYLELMLPSITGFNKSNIFSDTEILLQKKVYLKVQCAEQQNIEPKLLDTIWRTHFFIWSFNKYFSRTFYFLYCILSSRTYHYNSGKLFLSESCYYWVCVCKTTANTYLRYSIAVNWTIKIKSSIRYYLGR